MYNDIRGLHKNNKYFHVASKDFDIILCSETLVTKLRHISELLIPEQSSIPRARGLAVYVRSGFSASVRSDCKCSCHEVQLVRVCSRSNNFTFSVFTVILILTIVFMIVY